MAEDAGIPSFMSKLLARGIAINGPHDAARAPCLDLVRRSGVHITGDGEDALAVGAYLHIALCNQDGVGGGTAVPIGGGVDWPVDRFEAFHYAAPYSGSEPRPLFVILSMKPTSFQYPYGLWFMVYGLWLTVDG